MKPLFKKSNESSADYVERIKYRYYHHLRKIIPSLREQYLLESLVGPKNCWKQLMAYQIALLKDIGLAPHHNLLDIGCGPLAGGLNFIKYLEKGNYVGIDIRHEPLNQAYRLISNHKLAYKNPLILHSETFGKDELDGRCFDYIWVSQLVYHFDEEQTAELFERVTSLLESTGVFVFDIIAESEWKNVPDDATWRNFSFYFKNSEYYIDFANNYNLKGLKYGTLEKYGYPQKEGLRKNEILIFKRSAQSMQPVL